MHKVSTLFYPACYPFGFQALMVQVLITVYDSTHIQEKCRATVLYCVLWTI